MKDAAGGETERVLDEHGAVTREIRTVRGADGRPAKHVVTVREHRYIDEHDWIDPLEWGTGALNKPMHMTEWEPFEVLGADPGGTRYTARPTQKARFTHFKFAPKIGQPPAQPDPDYWQVQWSSTFDSTVASPTSPPPGRRPRAPTSGRCSSAGTSWRSRGRWSTPTGT